MIPTQKEVTEELMSYVRSLDGVNIHPPHFASLVMEKLTTLGCTQFAPDLLAVAEIAMSPERDSWDQYDAWHARLKSAATAAIQKAKDEANEKEKMIATTKYRPDRLLKLAEHLERGKLGHKRFDFRRFNDGPINAKGCGTLGCALGECPIVFPRHWKFEGLSFMPMLLLNSARSISPCDSAAQFFGVKRGDSLGLFTPGYLFAIWNKTGRSPGGKATKKQVAAAIRRFVKWKHKGN